MKFLKEPRTLIRNTTLVGVNNKQEVRNNGDKFKPVMAPWLFPVSVAVAMLIFLAISFSLHRKRTLKHRRRASQYYTLRYHRVAGPIFTCAAADLDSGNNNGEDVMERSDTPSRMTRLTSFSFKNTLGRYNTWSPRIFKHKITAHIAHKKRLASLRSQRNEILQIVDQLKDVTEGDNREDEVVSRLGSLFTGQPQLTNSELLSLADLTGFTRSYSCRGRAVGVTTYTGTLAIAEDNEDNQAAVTCDTVIAPAANSNLASPYKSATLASPNTASDHQVASPRFPASLTPQVNEDFVFNFDINDEMFNGRYRKVSQANLPRYLEDDWTSPVAFVTKPCSHLARSISSYDEGDEYSAGISPKLSYYNASYGDAQSTTDDAERLSPSLVVKNPSIEDYDLQIELNDPLEGFPNVTTPTCPDTNSQISASRQPDLLPTTNHDFEAPTTPTAVVRDEGQDNANPFSSKERDQTNSHLTIPNTWGSEINANRFMDEHILNQRTTSASNTKYIQGCDIISKTGSQDECGHLERDSSDHKTMDRCYNNVTSSKNFLEELSRIQNIVTSLEEDYENQQSHASDKNVNDKYSIDTMTLSKSDVNDIYSIDKITPSKSDANDIYSIDKITPSKRRDAFSKCSVIVTGSDPVDWENPRKAAVDANCNDTIHFNVSIGERSTVPTAVQSSKDTIVSYRKVSSDLTSMKRSSTDMVTSKSSQKDTFSSKGVISLFDIPGSDVYCSHDKCDHTGSLSDTNIQGLSGLDRQRKLRGSLSLQGDRWSSLCCESWEDGVDRDYMDKSLVSLHTFVIN